MRFQFLNDGSEFRSYGGGNFSKNSDGGGLFWWTILITLLMATATASWFFSILVFAHPEKPFNYNLLSKMEKLEPLRGYSKATAPYGPFRSANKLLTDYFDHSPEQLGVANDQLKRNYIQNFKDNANPTYVGGRYVVLGGRKLGANDVFTQGWALVTRSLDLEDVQVECILPNLESADLPVAVGEELKMDELFAPVLHVQRLENDRISATVVPIVFEKALKSKAGSSYTMQPPSRLNMEAAWPVLHDLKVDPNVQLTATPAAQPVELATNTGAQ
jgi:hypothetical protein